MPSGSPDPGLVRYERAGAIATITIDHPPVNVLSHAVLEGLLAALARARDDPDARVVVLRGASPKAFAAGADIKEMAPMGPDEAFRHGGLGQSVTVALEELPMPVLASVHGSCLGGGTEIALACDVVVAAVDAVFGQPEIRLGVMPGWGGTRRLPRRIGAAAARMWILTGRPQTAREALDAGLVARVVPRAELAAATAELAGELARLSATALASAKRALNRAIDPGRDEGLAYELALWAKLFGTPDQREGMRAFLEKRTPAVRPRRERTPAP
ncbi:MAG TPA: enoyl-CoA hydratase/isomerase family protein [Thermoplasmata archaeon]|nr:enoyl-CoA hydratase/isomerase family protein [Thermoplasmata archaeon]